MCGSTRERVSWKTLLSIVGLIAVSLAVASCDRPQSGTSLRTTPLDITSPPPAAATEGDWALSGKVVEFQSGAPVAGASVSSTADGRRFTAVTDGAGAFTFRDTVAPVSALNTTVTANGFVTRQTWIG